MNGYPYARGDLLERRNTYFYSPFGGEAFLSAWSTERESALGDLPAALPAPDSCEGRAPTDRLLERLYHAFSEGKQGRDEEWLLGRLIQRFEVSKRVHAEYNAEFRPVDAEDYRDLGRYLRFAEVLDAAIERAGGLPHLNAMLKCLDTLAALRGRLDADAAGRLARLIGREREHVTILARRMGVPA